jgi:hypothetical protein
VLEIDMELWGVRKLYLSFTLFLLVLAIKPRALHMLDKQSTTALHPQLLGLVLSM